MVNITIKSHNETMAISLPVIEYPILISLAVHEEI